MNKPSRLAWFSRLSDCFLVLWVCLDQFFCVAVRSPFYIVRGGEKPSADETLSAYVGRQAILNERWALIIEKLIDAVLGKGHCRAAIGHDDND